MTNLDHVISEIHAITDAAKNGTLIDRDALVKSMEGQINALVEAQVKAKVDSAPRRRVAGATHGEDGEPVVKDGNRYRAMVKDFATDGKHKAFGTTTLPIDIKLAGRLLSTAAKIQPDKFKGPSSDLQEVLKFLDPANTGAGAEYTPQNLAAELWQDFYMASRVAGALTTIPMTSDPFDIPRGFGAPTWRKGTPGTPIQTPDMATGDDQLKTTELVTQQLWSYTMDEDAVVALMPVLRAELARSGAEAIDAFALNADSTEAATGNINLDDALPAADSYYLSSGQDGIRHQHLVDFSAQTINNGGGALTDANITAALSRLEKYATDISGLVFVCDIGTYLRGFLNTSTGSPGSFVMTLDSFGPQAVVLTGQIGAYRGIPIIPSPVYPTVEADGKASATAGNNTLGSLSVFHRAMWRLGFRRELLIEMDRDIQSRQYVLVASFRQALACRGPRASARHTAGIRNILI